MNGRICRPTGPEAAHESRGIPPWWCQRQLLGGHRCITRSRKLSPAVAAQPCCCGGSRHPHAPALAPARRGPRCSVIAVRRRSGGQGACGRRRPSKLLRVAFLRRRSSRPRHAPLRPRVAVSGPARAAGKLLKGRSQRWFAAPGPPFAPGVGGKTAAAGRRCHRAAAFPLQVSYGGRDTYEVYVGVTHDPAFLRRGDKLPQRPLRDQAGQRVYWIGPVEVTQR